MFQDKAVMGYDLCVPRALRFVSKKKSEAERWTMANGVCVAAISMRHPEGRKERYEGHKSSVPLTVRVPCYSQVESLAAVTYYTNQKRIDEGVTPSELLTFRTLTGSNPRAVRTEAVPFFFPLAVARHGMDFMRPAAGSGVDGYDADASSDDDNGRDVDLADVMDAVRGGASQQR